MRILPWCPVFQFNHNLELQRRQYPDDVEGSTLWINGKPPTSIWESIKNVIYTDYLRVRIRFHTKCKSCSQ